MTLWRWLVSLLVWLSSDAATINREVPRAAAAVSAARASMVVDATPHPGPSPQDCDCGQTCVAGKWKPDGRVVQDCRCQCPRCVAERKK
jgi:hypothetical protein